MSCSKNDVIPLSIVKNRRYFQLSSSPYFTFMYIDYLAYIVAGITTKIKTVD